MRIARAIPGIAALGLAAGVVAPVAGATRGGWPDTDWTYIYEARLGQDAVANLGDFDELDGSWDDDNTFSLWFGDGITASGDPGGVESILRTGLGDNEGGATAVDAESLAIMDLGNGDSNQKIYFERFLTDGGDLGAGNPVIDFASGLTAISRFRFFSIDDLNASEPLRRALEISTADDAAIAAARTENAGSNEYDEGPREMLDAPNGMFMVSRGDVYTSLGGGPGGLYWGMNIDGDDSWDPSTFTTPPAAHAAVGVKVAFIVRGPENANATFQMSDARVVDRLRARGIEVTVLDMGSTEGTGGHNAYTNGSLTGPAAVAADHDLVMISSTVASTFVSGTYGYKSLNVPLIMWESGLANTARYALADAGGAVVNNQTQLKIVNNTHPITSGLSTGNQTILAGSVGRNMSFVGYTLPGAATDLGQWVSNSNYHGLVAYDPTVGGGKLADGSTLQSNQRWVFLPLEDDTFWALNATGMQIFDAAVEWALAPAKAALLAARPALPPAPPDAADWKPSFYINLGATSLLSGSMETRVLKGRFFRDTANADPAVPAKGGDTKVWANLPTGSMNDFVSVYITATPESEYSGSLPASRVRVYLNGSRCPAIEIQNHHLDPSITPAVGNGGANDGTGLGAGLWRPRAAGYLDVDYFGVKSSAVAPASGMPDVDIDGDVDGDDMDAFISCASGPAIGYAQTDPNCSCLDMDTDGDIDSSDFGQFVACLGDANTSPCGQ